MKIYFYYRQQSFHCLYSFTVFVPQLKLCASTDHSGLSWLVLVSVFLVTLGTWGSSCSHHALLLVLEPQLLPSLGKSIDSTSQNGERSGKSTMRKKKGTGEFELVMREPRRDRILDFTNLKDDHKEESDF